MTEAYNKVQENIRTHKNHHLGRGTAREGEPPLGLADTFPQEQQ